MWCPIRQDFCTDGCAFWNKEGDGCLLIKAAHYIPKNLGKIEKRLEEIEKQLHKLNKK